MKSKKTLKRLVRRVSAPVLSFVLVLSASLAAAALPADPDSGFGQGGTVLTEFDLTGSARVVLIQPDGKIIAAGHANYTNAVSNYDFAVVRYNADGSPDTSFGTGGRTITSILVRDQVRTGALQPDGKIIIAGSATAKFALVRYNADGSLDTGFGDGGKVVTDFVTSLEDVRSILIQPDGKIIAVGDDDNFYIYLARYNSDGTLDSTFGSGGKVTTHFADRGIRGRSALLQPDGKIVVGGDFHVNGETSNSALFRYNADGTPDNSFDGDGLAVYPLSDSFNSISKILFRPDGKLASVGTAVNAAENKVDYALGVYNADGTPDVSFGDQGFRVLPSDGRIELNGAIIQPDGKIVVAGTKSDPFGSRWRTRVVRFNSNGSFDFTFGNGGRLGLPIGYLSAGYAVAVQPDGKLLVAGEGMAIGNGKTKFALSRLQGGNGSIPKSANIAGRVINDFGRLGVGGVTVILTGGNLSAPRYAQTNPFGFYRFNDLPVGAEYDLTVVGKRNGAAIPRQIVLNGNENAEDLIYRPSQSAR